MLKRSIALTICIEQPDHNHTNVPDPGDSTVIRQALKEFVARVSSAGCHYEVKSALMTIDVIEDQPRIVASVTHKNLTLR